jgi:hypothetical protein
MLLVAVFVEQALATPADSGFPSAELWCPALVSLRTTDRHQMGSRRMRLWAEDPLATIVL